MLHAGLSLQIFKKWCSFEQNMIIIPGYCVAGTIGHKVLAGQKKIEIENRQTVWIHFIFKSGGVCVKKFFQLLF